MEIPKDAILDLLRERGDDAKASEAERELPDRVDTERHASLLQRLGLDPEELASSLGDRLPGGLGDKLPGGF
jgi:hypothetical protein